MMQENLKGAALSDTDTKTGLKSAMKALGRNNPATIPMGIDSQENVSVTGGKFSLFNLRLLSVALLDSY